MNEVVEEIRGQWDPVTAALVAAHVTLAYELDDAVVARLRRIAATTATLEFALTRAACWSCPAEGIYLAVDDAAGAIGALRRSLRVEDPAGLPYTPHVTLVHPRTATPEQAVAAWRALSGLRVDRPVTVHDVVVTRRTVRGWEMAERIRLTG